MEVCVFIRRVDWETIKLVNPTKGWKGKALIGEGGR